MAELESKRKGEIENNIKEMRSLQANFMLEIKTLQQTQISEKQELIQAKDKEISLLKQRVLDD